MDLETIDLSDQAVCYDVLVNIFHPRGLCCPRCGETERLLIHGRRRAPVLDYRCSQCSRVFNAWTNTPLRKSRLAPSGLVQLVRTILENRPTAQLARDLGRQRFPLERLRHRLQPTVFLWIQQVQRIPWQGR
jgi:transposase-like protein